MSSFYWTVIYLHWFCPSEYYRKYWTPLFHDSSSYILRQYLYSLLPASLPTSNSASQLLHALQQEMPHEKWGWTLHCKYGLTIIHFLYSGFYICINRTYDPYLFLALRLTDWNSINKYLWIPTMWQALSYVFCLTYTNISMK